MKIKNLLVATLLSASTLMITNNVIAQVQDSVSTPEMKAAEHRNHKNHKKHNMHNKGKSSFFILLHKIDLTAEQKDKIAEIRKNKKSQNRDDFKALHELLLQLEDVKINQNFDSNKAQNLIKQINEKNEKIDLENFNTEKQIYDILTTEQKQQLKKIYSEFLQKIKQNSSK